MDIRYDHLATAQGVNYPSGAKARQGLSAELKKVLAGADFTLPDSFQQTNFRVKLRERLKSVEPKVVAVHKAVGTKRRAPSKSSAKPKS